MGFKDECGVFGIFDHPEAANLTYLGLYALQHRGQESAGIVSSNGVKLVMEKGMGLVNDIFDQSRIAKLKGIHAIGHVRYSTTGESLLVNAQPFLVKYSKGSISIAHNGNIVNTRDLKLTLEAEGAIFQSTIDTEVIIHLLAHSKEAHFKEKLIDALSALKGAYSLVLLTEDTMIAVRDPNGFRPLVLGKLDGSYVVASETCAFDLIGATFEREIEPGEIFSVDANGANSINFASPGQRPTHCIFEHVYFARPDSFIFGCNVHNVRRRLGEILAEEDDVVADMVIPIPDSGVPASIGYATAKGLPFEMAIIRNHYVGRTFIEPAQSIRNFGVKIKLNPNRYVLKGKRVIVIDDSIVRGTTSKKMVKMLYDAGVKEVHFRVSSPPTCNSCYYGIDTPDREQLISSHMTPDEVCKFIGSDTLRYLSLEGLVHATGREGVWCDACFTGNYPVETERAENRPLQLDLFGLER